MADGKLKILYLKDILQKTDKDHALNATDICDLIQEEYGYTYERRAVYTDIKRLIKYGMKITQLKGASFGYYVSEHPFELPELKLLVDAVQSSKFITKEKSDILIRKLEDQTNKDNAMELQRHVFILNRTKTDNDAIYVNVDAIHRALRDDKQIRYKYCEWTLQKQLVPRKNGDDYVVSPWALTWDDENYYLVAYDSGKIKHYRVDKMQDITVIDEKRLGRDAFKGFDLAAYARKTFGMFGGSDRKITLEGDNRLVGVIIDRFGTDVIIQPVEGERFHVTVTVSVSPQFFGWLAGLSGGMRIFWPDDVLEEYREYLRKVIDS